MRLTTIDQHIISQQRKFPGVSGEFSGLLYDIALAAKLVSKEINRAGLGDLLGSFGEVNVQGEIVQKMDKFANELFIRILSTGGRVCAIATEENERIIEIHDDGFAGKYAINMDPLDGSSNIDVNVSVGTIFSLHRKRSPGRLGAEEDCLQAGSRQVGAGYVIYGSSTMLVYTTGMGVHGFTLDPTLGEFILSHPDMRMPTRCSVYSVNEGNSPYWDEGTREYVGSLKIVDTARGRPYSLRYIGSLVSDVHRNLLRGGVFLYPADHKDPTKPSGKLRLLFEAAPMALIVEQAGGAATTGTERVLDIVPTHLHQRVPLILGPIEEVARYEAAVKRALVE